MATGEEMKPQKYIILIIGSIALYYFAAFLLRFDPVYLPDGTLSTESWFRYKIHCLLDICSRLSVALLLPLVLWDTNSKNQLLSYLSYVWPGILILTIIQLFLTMLLRMFGYGWPFETGASWADGAIVFFGLAVAVLLWKLAEKKPYLSNSDLKDFT